MTDRTVLDVARGVVGTLAPDELSGLDLVARAHAAAPGAARRARRGRAEPTGSGFTIGGQVISSLVIGIGIDLCKDLLVDGLKAAGKSGWRRMFSRRPAVDPATAVPPIAEDEAPLLQQRATEAARERGAPGDVADQVGTTLAREWPRRS